MKRLTVVVPDAEMGPTTSADTSANYLTSGHDVPCTLVLTVDAELLAALARPPSHRAALVAEAEGRRAG